MKRNITHVTRDRYLTPEEAATYRKVREQIEAEKPEINARIRAKIEGLTKLSAHERLAMQSPQSPLTWAIPNWHSDFGNVGAEVDHLRSLALALPAVLPGVVLTLKIEEPGLMYLRVEQNGLIAAEVYSNSERANSVEREFALFFWPESERSEEVYADTVEMALRSFVTRR